MLDPFMIKRPIVTEKATDLGKQGKYIFMVKSSAKKPEIRKAVMAMYRVDVTSVNVVNKPSKRKRLGALKGSQRGYKKAIVTLKAGQKIDLQ